MAHMLFEFFGDDVAGAQALPVSIRTQAAAGPAV
jgi:hypothetical protein